MEYQATRAVAAGRCPPWSRPGEALRLFARGVTVRRCVPVAAVVGTVLSAINEGAQITSGNTSWATWVRVGLNFVVPFLVSSYGYLAAGHARGPSPSPGAGV
jgi:hypothetical protein